MEDHVEAALHVGGAGAVNRLVVQPDGFLERVIDRKNRIHMAGQDKAAFGTRAHAKDHVLPVRFLEFPAFGADRRDLRRFHQFDIAR